MRLLIANLQLNPGHCGGSRLHTRPLRSTSFAISDQQVLASNCDHWLTEPQFTFHSFSVKEEEAWSLDCSSHGPITHVALHAKSNLYALFTQVQDGP